MCMAIFHFIAPLLDLGSRSSNNFKIIDFSFNPMFFRLSYRKGLNRPPKGIDFDSIVRAYQIALGELLVNVHVLLREDFIL